MTWFAALPILPIVAALIVTCGCVILAGPEGRAVAAVALVALSILVWALAWGAGIEIALALLKGGVIDLPSTTWLSGLSGALCLASWAIAGLALVIITRLSRGRIEAPLWLITLAALSWMTALIGTQLGQAGSWPLSSRLIAAEALCLTLVLGTVARDRKPKWS